MSKIHLYFLASLLFFSLPLVVCGKDAIEIRIDTGAFKDGIFPRGERVILGATLQNRTKVPVKASIIWKIETDEKAIDCNSFRWHDFGTWGQGQGFLWPERGEARIFPGNGHLFMEGRQGFQFNAGRIRPVGAAPPVDR